MYIVDHKIFKEGVIFWDSQVDSQADVDIFFFIHDYECRAKYAYGFKSLEIDLKQATEASIVANYRPTVRREIFTHALRYDFQVVFHQECSEALVARFVKNFNEFAIFKGLRLLQVEFLMQIARDKRLIISEIIYEQQTLAMHSYYVNDQRARLYHAFSTNNQFDSKVNGIANKKLIHHDICFFQGSLNLKVYDFGGIGNVSGDNRVFEGIINFKKGFGGKEITLWKGVTPNGPRGEAIYQKYWLQTSATSK